MTFFVIGLLSVILAVYLQRLGVKRSSDNVFGGVCAGIANHYQLPVPAVRIVWVLLTLGLGIGLLTYLILWVTLPE